MINDVELREAFSLLHPLCVELNHNPCVNSLRKLKVVLSSLDPSIVEELQEFVLFSFRIVFKTLKTRPEKFKIEFFQCLNVLLTQSENIVESEVFYELINNVILNICPPLPDETSDECSPKTYSVSEEIKLEGITALDLLFSNASYEVLLKFYLTNSSLPFLGHAVSVLLDFFENEKLRSLRVSTLQVLLRLSFCCTTGPRYKNLENRNKDEVSIHDCNEFRDKFCPVHSKNGPETTKAFEFMASIVGNIFASFLPGISMSLTKVATGDPKQGQLVISRSIVAFTQIIERTFSDKFLENLKEKQIDLNNSQDSHKDLLVKKTPDWVDGTSKKLCFLIEKIIDGTVDGGWKVRMEIIKMSEAFLINCCKSLSKASEKLLNVIISGLVDDEPMVKQLADEAVQSLRSKLKSGSDQKETDLVELLEENFFKLVEDLPTLLNSSNDRKKLSGLCLFHGYLKMLGVKSSILTSSSFLMDKFLKSMFNLLEFDCSTLVVCNNAGDDLQILRHGLMHERLPSYPFKKFTDDRILEEVISILNLIGQFWDLDYSADQLLEAMMTSKKFKKQSAFCLVHVLNGTRSLVERSDQLEDSTRSWSKLERVIDRILSQILDKSFWSQIFEPPRILHKKTVRSSQDLNSRLLVAKPTRESLGGGHISSKYNKHVTSSLKEIKEESTFACLLLDLVGASALLSGLNFEPNIAKVLVPILERIGSSRHDVRTRALKSLLDISSATSLSRSDNSIGGNLQAMIGKVGGAEKDVIGEMLMRCSDYLMSSIIPSLRVTTGLQRVLVALTVVLELGTPKFHPIVGSEADGFGSSFYDLVPHHHMMNMICSSFKQILTSFDNHHHDFCFEFWKLLLQASLLVSRTIHLEKSLHANEHLTNQSQATTTQQHRDGRDDHHNLTTATPTQQLSTVINTCNGSSVISDSKDDDNYDNVDDDNYNNNDNVDDDTSGKDKCDIHESHMSRVLMEYVKELEKNWRTLEQVDEKEGHDDDDDGENVYERMKEISEEGKGGDDDDDAVDKQDEVEVPYYVPMLEQILERCQHFLISSDPQIRTIVLEVVSVVCPTLKPFQDNLLPLVHKIWMPFVGRFSDEEHFVCSKAFDTLKVVTDSSGDFVRRRILKDIVPKVISLLLSLAKKSHKSPLHYKFSTAYRLQRSVLKSLGGICRQSGIQGQPLCDLIKSSIPYLSALQPTDLQEACLATFKEFINIDSDIVWLLLTEIYCPIPVLTPPSDSNLQPIKLIGPSKRNEYTDNTTILYEILKHQ